MAWYKTGSIKATQNSNVVTGTGTDWKNNLYGIGEGQALVFGNNRVEIAYVVSNTELRLAEPYKGATYNGNYHIENMFAGGAGDYVRQISAAIRRFAEWGLDLNEWFTSQSDFIEIKDPIGNIVKVPTMKSQLKIGDYGIGYVATNNNNPKQNIYKDANDVDFTGFATGNASSVNFFDYGAPLLSMARFGGSDSTGQIFQMQPRVSKTNNEIAYRTRNVNEWTDWIKLALLDTQKTQEFSGGIKARIVDAVGGNNYVGLRVHSDGTSALYGFRNGSGFDYTLPTYSGEAVLKQGSYIVNYGTTDWTGVKLYKGNKEYIVIEGSSGANTLMQLAYRNTSGNNVAVVDIPKKNGTLMLAGDYGVGSGRLVSENRFDDFGDGLDSGFYSYVNPKQIPDGVTAYGNVISIKYDAQNWQKLIFSNYGAYFHVQRCINGSRSTVQVMTKDMWTVDGNGFYKKSSPIIKIKPNGDFIVNNESEGAIVEKVGVGHYRVLNVEGFHSDLAWGVDGGISVPKDHNDNPLIWVEPEVNADGSIDIYTFHRENYIPDSIRKMRERRLNKMGGVYASKIDGEPCDIPEGAFIDVRVEMPYNSIYNVKTRAIERVLALENLIRVQQEILNNKTLQLPLL